MMPRSALLLVSFLWLPHVFADAPSAEDVQHFERRIRPLLSRRCFSCHSQRAKTIHGGLRLDRADDLRRGGDSGAAVVPGKPEESLLVKAIGYEEDIQMPPDGKLPEAEIAELVAWIASGAFFPTAGDQPSRADGEIDFKAGRNFWSFQRVRPQPLPQLANQSWPQQRMDAFVLAGLERAGLTPSPQADRTTLIRRVYFDLIGLPPQPAQVREFVNDPSPLAFENLVDRLLSSPQYGEKWARMWLDMARYTDRTASWLYKNGQPHLYRDWVGQAMNDDLPYDQFVHRQLATDMMPGTGPEDLPALGFIGLSPAYWKELKLPCEIIKVIVADEWEERVDAVSRTFLGLTVACARCHDHKFDPISSEDYYALAGVFASCRLQERPVIDEKLYQPVQEAKQEIEKLEAEIKELKKTKPKEGEAAPQAKIDALTAKILELKGTPHFDAPLASAVVDESLYVVRAGKLPENGTRLDYRPGPKDLPLFVRGNPNRPGPIVRRRFLKVLSDDPQPFQSGSGRLELARSITGDAAPLAARVIVNRIWLAHFGRGIVTTPSNFGRQGSRPTHPELLDDLAARFIAGGWSIKKLHREILLSATWQQASAVDETKAAIDPNNVRLWRMNRRRLEFESWRDAMLAVSSELDTQKIGGRPFDFLSEQVVPRRSVYGFVNRDIVSSLASTFDAANPNSCTAKRPHTNVPQQTLFALNSDFIQDRAIALAKASAAAEPSDDEARVRWMYQRAYSRVPQPEELQTAMQFVRGSDDGDDGQAKQSDRWQQFAHVLLAANEFVFVD